MSVHPSRVNCEWEWQVKVDEKTHKKNFEMCEILKEDKNNTRKKWEGENRYFFKQQNFLAFFPHKNKRKTHKNRKTKSIFKYYHSKNFLVFFYFRIKSIIKKMYNLDTFRDKFFSWFFYLFSTIDFLLLFFLWINKNNKKIYFLFRAQGMEKNLDVICDC
jgi:hypothetical protein